MNDVFARYSYQVDPLGMSYGFHKRLNNRLSIKIVVYNVGLIILMCVVVNAFILLVQTIRTS